MATHLSNRIRKLSWKVRIPSTADTFSMRQRLRDGWEERLLPVFEKRLNAIVTGNTVVHIPKIELFLKAPSEAEFFDLLRELLDRELALALPCVPGHTVPLDSRTTEWLVIPPSQSGFDTLGYYLCYGVIPWQATEVSPSALALTLRETARQQWPVLLSSLRDRVRDVDAACYSRLFQLLSDEEAVSAVVVLSEQLPREWQTFLTQIVSALLSDLGQTGRHVRIKLAAALLSEAMKTARAGGGTPNVVSIADRVLSLSEAGAFHKFVTSLPESVAALFKPQTETVTNGMTDPSEAFSSERQFPTLERRSRILPFPLVGEAWNGGRDRTDVVRTNPSGALSPPLTSPQSASRPRWREGETPFSVMGQSKSASLPFGNLFPLTVHHAGLILLHPFFTRFFEHLGVTPQEEITRAAALLHFLATGNEVVYEYELGCIKVLLGLHPETPLPIAEGLIQTRDREEAGALLQSVIGYWTVLKKTSVDGLRRSFLARPALLREEERGWKLYFERTPFDMLLDRLPWGISIIKLSWMTKPIHTQW
jgi:hypothetical protein